MYAIVLAGGYAKRLWPLTLNTPKALLPIAGRPILDYVVEKLEDLKPPPARIVLSTNLRFQPQFEEWIAARAYGNVELVADVSESEAQKPGAIKAMANIILSSEEDDVLVIAGDGMFHDDLRGMLQVFSRRRTTVVAFYNARDLEEAKRCATVKADAQGLVLRFIEKPAKPDTMMVCGAVYLFPKKIRARFEEYLQLDLPMDQPGRFVEWLSKQEPVYGYMLKDHLWDIGTHEAYHECDTFFSCSSLRKEKEAN